MITREEYLKALDIVEEYHKQLNLSNVRQLREQLSPDLDRNDYIEYVGGSDSKYLTKGNKYRLTRKPNRNKICIINDGGKRMFTNARYFKGD
jgi:hypothetical protein